MVQALGLGSYWTQVDLIVYELLPLEMLYRDLVGCELNLYIGSPDSD